MAGPAAAVVRGFGDDPAEPDPGPTAPAGAEQAAEPPASGMTGTTPDPGGPRAKLNGLAAEPDGRRAEPQANGASGSAHDPDRPETKPDAPGAEPRANGVNGSAHDPDRAGTEPDAAGAEPGAPGGAPNGQPAAGDAAVGDQIGSYYDEADRAMSDYLAAMGWTGEQETHGTG